MTRGGRTKDRTGPERRCIVSGDSGPTGPLIRFVLSPDGVVVADLAGKLPGRGAWVTADRKRLETAVKKRLFNRAFRTQATIPADLVASVEQGLVTRLVNTISMARKAGQAVTGFEKVKAHLISGGAGVLIQACDGSMRGRAKLDRAPADLPRIAVLTGSELGLAFGREFAIHAALDAGGFADRALAEADRLLGFRPTGDEHAGKDFADEGAGRDHGLSAADEDGRERPGGGLSGQGDR